MQPLIRAYMEMPPITRFYITSCVVLTLLCEFKILSPFQLYYHWELVYVKFQIWRLITSFCYFGSLGFNFLFSLIFAYRHCHMLEEGSFNGRTADFVYMFIFNAIILVIFATVVGLAFLGQAFTLMLVYLWSRRNPFVRMNVFEILSFNAPYLPWVCLFFSLLLGNNALYDLIGIICGHMYYFAEDVFPNLPYGYRILETPTFLKRIFDPPAVPYVEIPDRPGGYNWGANDPERDRAFREAHREEQQDIQEDTD